MEIDILSFELGMEDAERLREFPLWPCFYEGSVIDAI